jgi:nitrate reductase NapE component
MLLILFFLMNSIPEFNDLTVLNVIIVVQFGLLIWMYSPVTHPPKRAINILNMMKPPTFPAGMEICPDCIQVKE